LNQNRALDFSFDAFSWRFARKRYGIAYNDATEVHLPPRFCFQLQQSLLRTVSSPSFATGGRLCGDGGAGERKSSGVWRAAAPGSERFSAAMLVWAMLSCSICCRTTFCSA
jgi:hypothetical protein